MRTSVGRCFREIDSKIISHIFFSGSVMCRIKNNITIAHKNVARHLVQCRASDKVPFKSRERNHDYGHKGTVKELCEITHRFKACLFRQGTVAEWFNAVAY